MQSSSMQRQWQQHAIAHAGAAAHKSNSIMQRQQQHAKAAAACQGSSTCRVSWTLCLQAHDSRYFTCSILAYVSHAVCRPAANCHWHMMILVQVNMPVGHSGLPDTAMPTGMVENAVGSYWWYACKWHHALHRCELVICLHRVIQNQ